LKRAEPKAAQAGFSLVEVLVATAVFGLAALALLRLEALSLATATRLDERLLARIVAENQAIEAELGLGAASGTESAGGISWRWQRQAGPSPLPGLARTDIIVTAPDGDVAARASVLGPAA
jgi:general secretion pathway protein I